MALLLPSHPSHPFLCFITCFFFLFFSFLVIYFIFLSFILRSYKIPLDHLRRVVRFSRVCSRRVSGRAGSAAYAGSLCFFCRGLFGAQYFMLLVARSDRPWACSTWQRQTVVHWMGPSGGDPGIWRGRVGSRVSGSGHVQNLMHAVDGPLFNL